MKSSLKDLSEVEISLDSTLSFILFKKKTWRKSPLQHLSLIYFIYNFDNFVEFNVCVHFVRLRWVLPNFTCMVELDVGKTYSIEHRCVNSRQTLTKQQLGRLISILNSKLIKSNFINLSKLNTCLGYSSFCVFGISKN